MLNIKGEGLWHTVKVLTVDTTGRKQGKISPAAITTTRGPLLVNTMNRRVMTMKMNKCWNCEECIHFIPETMDDVTCCSCCEDGSFFEECEDKYTLADLGNNWW